MSLDRGSSRHTNYTPNSLGRVASPLCVGPTPAVSVSSQIKLTGDRGSNSHMPKIYQVDRSASTDAGFSRRRVLSGRKRERERERERERGVGRGGATTDASAVPTPTLRPPCENRNKRRCHWTGVVSTGQRIGRGKNQHAWPYSLSLLAYLSLGERIQTFGDLGNSRKTLWYSFVSFVHIRERERRRRRNGLRDLCLSPPGGRYMYETFPSSNYCCCTAVTAESLPYPRTFRT